MSEVANLVAGGAIALLGAWVYLDTYRHPHRNALTSFISSWYEKHALSFLRGGRMILLIGVCFVVAGLAMWSAATWKFTTR